MTREEQNRFLTEAMGLCWHIPDPDPLHEWCEKCGTFEDNIDFFTWPGFGMAWEWAQSKEWWEEFVDETMPTNIELKLNTYNPIHPERFALALAEFLKGRKG